MAQTKITRQNLAQDILDALDAAPASYNGGWTKYVVSYTQVVTGGPTAEQDYQFFTAAPGQMIHGCVVVPTIPFTGGGLTGVTLSVGVSGLDNKYGADTDVFTTPLNSSLTVSPGIESLNSNAPVYAHFSYSSGSNVNLTQGSVNLYLQTSQLPL